MVNWLNDPEDQAKKTWDENQAIFESTVFPQLQPFNRGNLVVDKSTGQSLPFEQFGRTDYTSPGVQNAVYLHGGPGAGRASYYPRFFPPDMHVVVYDQRGAPQSSRPALLENNTPDLLIDDNELLRKHLGIERWSIVGGSWGSTLALLYAERYPTATQSLVLRGVFLMTRKEIDWFLHDMGRFFPEARSSFEGYLPSNERTNILEAYYKRLISGDPYIHMPAARAWAGYENTCVSRQIPPLSARNDSELEDLCIARLEAAFLRNHPLGDRIMKDIDTLRDIPTLIVQGRHDVVCPPETAHQLAGALPKSRLLLADAGHSAKEPEIAKALVDAAKRIAAAGTPLP